MDRTAEDIAQDRRLAALEQSAKDAREDIDHVWKAVRDLHVRIDRTAVPTLPPVTGFWSFLLRLFGK